MDGQTDGEMDRQMDGWMAKKQNKTVNASKRNKDLQTPKVWNREVP